MIKKKERSYAQVKRKEAMRKLQPDWKDMYPWTFYDDEKERVFLNVFRSSRSEDQSMPKPTIHCATTRVLLMLCG